MVQVSRFAHQDRAVVYDTQTGRVLLTLTGHKGPVAYAGFSRDGRLIATRGKDGTVRIWDAVTGRQLHVFSVPLQDWVQRISADSRQLVVISVDQFRSGGDMSFDIRVFDLSSEKLVRTFAGHYDGAIATSDGRGLILTTRTAAGSSVVTVQEMMDGKIRFEKPNSRLAYPSSDGRWFYVLTAPDTPAQRLEVIDAETGRTVASLPHPSFLLPTIFVESRRVFIPGSKLTIWSLMSGQQLASLPLEGDNPLVQVSPDGKRIATYNFSKRPSNFSYVSDSCDLTLWNSAPLPASAPATPVPGQTSKRPSPSER